MLKREAFRGASRRIILMDSITQVTMEDAGCMVIAASHGGLSSAEFALQVPLHVVVFNDAGVGKDDAGIAALALLERHGVAAATIAHDSARIGDSLDMWTHGIVSHVNSQARALGIAVGQPVKPALIGMSGQT